MSDAKIVITGARSFAGNLLFRHILELEGFAPVAIHSPAAYDPAKRGQENIESGADTIVADLTKRLERPVADALAGAARVFHFAWNRSLEPTDCLNKNLAMVDNLMGGMTDPRRFIFISSPAAGSRSPGVYGATKFAIEKTMLERGGSVLIVGLITSPEAGTAYETIRRSVCRLPFRFHFDSGYRFYPVDPEGLVEACAFFLHEFAGGTYLSFPPEGIGCREFLAAIEAQCPRLRFPIFIHTGLGLLSVRMAAKCGLVPRRLAEKLSSFLYRDRRRIASLPQAIEGQDR